jgi:hypothetical protein
VRFALTPEAESRVRTQAAVKGYVLWYARTLYDAVHDDAAGAFAERWRVTRPTGNILCVEGGGAEFLAGIGTATSKHADIDLLWKLVRTAHEEFGNLSRADLIAVVKDAQRRAGTVGGKEDLETSMYILRNSGVWLFSHGKRGLRANKRLVRTLLGGKETGATLAALDKVMRECDSSLRPAGETCVDPQTADPARAVEAIDEIEVQAARTAAETARRERLIRQAVEEARAACAGARGLEGAILYVADLYRNGGTSRKEAARLGGTSAKALRHAEARYVAPVFARVFG